MVFWERVDSEAELERQVNRTAEAFEPDGVEHDGKRVDGTMAVAFAKSMSSLERSLDIKSDSRVNYGVVLLLRMLRLKMKLGAQKREDYATELTMRKALKALGSVLGCL